MQKTLRLTPPQKDHESVESGFVQFSAGRWVVHLRVVYRCGAWVTVARAELKGGPRDACWT